MDALNAKAVEVERALRLLVDSGLVKSVRTSAVPGYEHDVPRTHVIVAIDDDLPERHHPEIQRLVEQAGVSNIILRIERFKKPE